MKTITEEWMRNRIKELDKEVDELHTYKTLVYWPNEGMNLRYIERLYWKQRLKDLK